MNWEIISKFYEDLADTSEWKDFAAMEKFVKHLISNRNLENVFAHTSHELLVITKSENYIEWSKEPNIIVELNVEASEEYLYKFSFVEPFESNEIIRFKQENVFCSFEKSLEVFDELFEKLKELTPNNSQINSLK